MNHAGIKEGYKHENQETKKNMVLDVHAIKFHPFFNAGVYVHHQLAHSLRSRPKPNANIYICNAHSINPPGCPLPLPAHFSVEVCGSLREIYSNLSIVEKGSKFIEIYRQSPSTF